MTEKWSFKREISLAFLLQLILLGALILGSWMRVQNQLTVLQRDVKAMLVLQEKNSEKVQHLQLSCIGYEYRLDALEKKEKRF